MDVSAFVSYRDRLVSACSKAIVGKKREITLIDVCHVCGGHVLLEDVPGTGKTMLFRAFAKACGGSFKRIQFTPDVMPGDVTGIHFYNMKTGDFEFRPGPVFADMVLADEINRATPRTQSSLLEAMAERQVSVDGETHRLSGTFMVAARSSTRYASSQFAVEMVPFTFGLSVFLLGVVAHFRSAPSSVVKWISGALSKIT